MILVVGATGSLGGRITRGLLAQGKAVRILARNNPISAEMAKQGRANTAQSLIEAGAQAVYGDLKDRASLDAAVRGADTVITTATATQRGGDDTVPAVDLHGTLSLIEAAKAAGVEALHLHLSLWLGSGTSGAAVQHQGHVRGRVGAQRAGIHHPVAGHFHGGLDRHGGRHAADGAAAHHLDRRGRSPAQLRLRGGRGGVRHRRGG